MSSSCSVHPLKNGGLQFLWSAGTYPQALIRIAMYTKLVIQIQVLAMLVIKSDINT